MDSIVSKCVASDILGRKNEAASAAVDDHLRCSADRVLKESIEFENTGLLSSSSTYLKSKYELLKPEPSARKFASLGGARNSPVPAPAPAKRVGPSIQERVGQKAREREDCASSGGSSGDGTPARDALKLTGLGISLKMPPPKRVLYPVEKLVINTRKIRPSMGLKNLGNTCFLNSVLQCITYTPPLFAYLSSRHHDQADRSNAGYGGPLPQGCPINPRFCSLCMVKSHMSRVIEQETRTSFSVAVVPTHVVRNLKLVMKSYITGRQEDAHEFLRFLVDHMQTCSLLQFAAQKLDMFTKETTPISRIFGGFHRNEITCCICKSQSVTFDPFYDICLEVKNFTTVKNALTHFTKRDVLQGANAYSCPKCKKQVQAHKIYRPHRLPAVLTIQLKRFDAHLGKINNKVVYDETLNMREFMSDPTGPAEVYRLYGVVVHVGHSTHSGHYFAYVRSPLDPHWYRMDDASVSQVPKGQALGSAGAYVLFYVRTAPLNYIDGGAEDLVSPTSRPPQKRMMNGDHRPPLMGQQGQRSKSLVTPPEVKSRGSPETVPEDPAPSSTLATQPRPPTTLSTSLVNISQAATTHGQLSQATSQHGQLTTSNNKLKFGQALPQSQPQKTSAFAGYKAVVTPHNIPLPPKVHRPVAKKVADADSTDDQQGEKVDKMSKNPFLPDQKPGSPSTAFLGNNSAKQFMPRSVVIEKGKIKSCDAPQNSNPQQTSCDGPPIQENTVSTTQLVPYADASDGDSRANSPAEKMTTKTLTEIPEKNPESEKIRKRNASSPKMSENRMKSDDLMTKVKRRSVSSPVPKKSKLDSSIETENREASPKIEVPKKYPEKSENFEENTHFPKKSRHENPEPDNGEQRQERKRKRHKSRSDSSGDNNNSGECRSKSKDDRKHHKREISPRFRRTSIEDLASDHNYSKKEHSFVRHRSRKSRSRSRSGDYHHGHNSKDKRGPYHNGGPYHNEISSSKSRDSKDYREDREEKRASKYESRSPSRERHKKSSKHRHSRSRSRSGSPKPQRSPRSHRNSPSSEIINRRKSPSQEKTSVDKITLKAQKRREKREKKKKKARLQENLSPNNSEKQSTNSSTTTEDDREWKRKRRKDKKRGRSQSPPNDPQQKNPEGTAEYSNKHPERGSAATDVAKDLQPLVGEFRTAYGSKVLSWDGSTNSVDQSRDSEGSGMNDSDQEYNDQYDREKTKKKKSKHKTNRGRSGGNSFQEIQDKRANRDE